MLHNLSPHKLKQALLLKLAYGTAKVQQSGHLPGARRS